MTAAYSFESNHFEIKIIRSAQGPVIFRLHEDTLKTIVYSGGEGYDWGKIKKNKTIRLNSKKYSEVLKVKSKIDLRDIKELDRVREDGSTWEVKILSIQDATKALISSPTINPDTRNLNDVIEIVRLLARYSNNHELLKNLY
jgi:hypothetical protein